MDGTNIFRLIIKMSLLNQKSGYMVTKAVYKYACNKQGWEEGEEEGEGEEEWRKRGEGEGLESMGVLYFIVDKIFLLSMRLRDRCPYRYKSSWFPG